MTTVHPDITTIFQEKNAKGSAPVEKQVAEYLPWNVHLHKSFESSTERNKITKLLGSVGALTNKDVTGVDLGPVRIVSLYPIIAQLVNLETKFLNVLKSRAPFIMSDTECRIPEESINGDQLSAFHPESTLPGVQQSVLSERDNTLMALGQQINVSYLADELSSQSPYRRNEIQAQVQKALIRLDRTLNPVLLSSVEQSDWSLNSIPAMGGFVTRSTYAPQVLNGGNLTDQVLATSINSMAAIFGYDQLTDVVGFTNNTQISVIRNLMINRYPGNNAMTKMEYDSVLAKRLMAQGISIEDVQVVYEDNNGLMIPFIREMQLPAGTTLLWRTSLPQLAMFKLQQNLPPYLIERPVTNLYHLSVLFGLYSLADPLVQSRTVISGHS